MLCMSERNVLEEAGQREPGRAVPVGEISDGDDEEEKTNLECGDVDGLLADVGGVEGRDEVVDGETHGWCGDGQEAGH